jgi:hypothetical protein
MRTRIPRTKGAISGVIVIVLGLWGALVPFIGPYIGLSLHTDQTWHWFTDRAWLEALPGAVAVIGGIVMVRGGARSSISLGAMLGLAAGLWFVAGPMVSTLWNHGVVAVGPALGIRTLTRALAWIAYFYGVGALLILFSSYALGFIAAMPAVDERVVGATVGTSAGRRRRWRAPAADPAAAPTREKTTA